MHGLKTSAEPSRSSGRRAAINPASIPLRSLPGGSEKHRPKAGLTRQKQEATACSASLLVGARGDRVHFEPEKHPCA